MGIKLVSLSIKKNWIANISVAFSAINCITFYSLSSGRILASKNKLIAIFQPHRYSRLKDLFDEFCQCGQTVRQTGEFVALEIELLEFDVLETMKSIAHLLIQGDTSYSKHQIVWIHEEVSYSILYDNSMFSLMVQNLLSNALKYSAEEASPKVTIETKKIGKFLEITIRDNGIGFAPGSKEKLFNMFYREKRGNFEGTGVGLASALTIADILNAFIQADGKEGEGACFILTIPLTLSPKSS